MQHVIHKTGVDVQYVTDRYGKRVFVQIPFAQWEMIRAQLVNIVEEPQDEEREETPEVIDRDGILVVRAKAVGDLANVVREERDHRIIELMERAQT